MKSRLAIVATRLYKAGRWSTDGLSESEQARLWADLRDALGLAQGTATSLDVGCRVPARGLFQELAVRARVAVNRLRYFLFGVAQEANEPGSEVLCESCARAFCPDGERLHFHHDGCPACYERDPKPTRQSVLAWLEQGDNDVAYLLADGFEEAFLGVGFQFTNQPVTLYDRDRCIDILAREMPREDAKEFFEFNVAGAYVGKQTPMFVTLKQ